MMPSKEELIRKVWRDRFIQSVFNVVTIMALMGIVYVSYIRYEMDILTVTSALSTFVVLGIIYFYTKYLNNRIRLNLHITKSTIDNYEEVKQMLKGLLNDKQPDAGKKQDSEN
jgi:hypothetical protein